MYAQVKLRLTDKEDGQERTPLDGREFEVTLPAPGHAEFVVPLARFEAAISREWMATPQDCQVSGADAQCILTVQLPREWQGELLHVLTISSADLVQPPAVRAAPVSICDIWACASTWQHCRLVCRASADLHKLCC